MSKQHIHINPGNFQNIHTIDFYDHNQVNITVDRGFAKACRSMLAKNKMEPNAQNTPRNVTFEVKGLNRNESFRLHGKNASGDPSIFSRLSENHPSMTRTDTGFRFTISLGSLELLAQDSDEIPMSLYSPSNLSDSDDTKKRKTESNIAPQLK